MERIIEIVKVLPYECPHPCGDNCLFCEFCEEIDIESKEITCSYEKMEEKTDEYNN